MASGIREQRELLIEELSQFGAFGTALGLELGAARQRCWIGDQRRLEWGFAIGENAVQRVVIGLWDRVVLVVVAPRASDGEAQETARRHVDLVIDDVVDVVVVHSPQRQQPHGRQPPRFDRRLDEIGRQLVLDKAIVRQILVEGADHVIAVGVRVRTNPIIAVHQHAVLRVGEPGDIEPMSGPPFAMAGRSEQSVDDPCQGRVGRPRSCFELLDFLPSRWQADQVVVDSPQDCPPIGFVGGTHSGRFEFGEYEAVDRRGG